MGFVTYAAIKILTGRIKEVGPGVGLVALAYVAKVALT